MSPDCLRPPGQEERTEDSNAECQRRYVASERICEAPKRDRDIEQSGAEEKTLGTIVGLN